MDIDELRQKIREANDAYWKKSTSIVSDTEYDRMIENLRKLSPNDPLLDEIGKEKLGEIKVHHVKQMLSLDKHYNWSEMIAWACKVARSDNELFMCSPKYDGLSLEQQGERIVTRGDGVIGTDITHLSSHICVISRYEYDADGKIIGDKMGLVPILENEDIANPTRMVGELLIPYWRFDRLKAEYPEIFQEYKTPRNLISGFANSKYDSVIAQLGYGVGQSVYIADFVSHRAFEIPITLKDLKNGKDPRPAIMKFVNDKHVDYPVDGIVIRLADDQYASSLGVTQHHPLGSMAFKFTSEQVKAKVTRVTWQIGEERVSPIAEFDPVQLDGVMVKRATLHNPTWVKVNKVGIGSTVVIERRGKVIPSVMDVINEDPNINVVVPDRCPACGEKLVPDGCYLKCTNDECTGKIATKIVRGLSVLGLKGCGPKLVTKAVKEFYIRDIIDWVNTFGSRDQHALDLLKLHFNVFHFQTHHFFDGLFHVVFDFFRNFKHVDAGFQGGFDTGVDGVLVFHGHRHFHAVNSVNFLGNIGDIIFKRPFGNDGLPRIRIGQGQGAVVAQQADARHQQPYADQQNDCAACGILPVSRQYGDLRNKIVHGKDPEGDQDQDDGNSRHDDCV